MVADFYKRDPEGNIDRIYEKLLKDAPAVKQAEAKLLQAEQNLADAQLNLRYCKVLAEIDGVVTRRNVNPGNNVVAGQSLMAVRSITEIWIDANFKETQLRNLRIGQPVSIDVDMYGRHEEFTGRISGFTMGTGSTLALLPPQNATGNFVKVVQRLPVRIDLIDYDPQKTPLFIGLSVNAACPYPRGADRSEQRNVSAGGNGRHDAGELSPGANRERRRTESAACPTSSSPWLVAIAVVIPTFMEVLDTTIANVALRYIAGGLSAPANDSEWVITSYLAANAIILPISGWLALRLGRRNYFLGSIAVFTLASALCGMATSLGVLIAARVLQGLAGGGLQPSSQAVLLDAFPPEKQGQAMTIFAVAALLAPVFGPTLGGYITDNYGWRWIFYLNVPVGLLALANVQCRCFRS